MSQILLQAIQERESFLRENVKQLDASLAKILRLVGQQVMSLLFNSLAEQVTQEEKQKGLVIHRHSRIKYSVIFGNIEVDSPYLWDKKQHREISPVKERLGIKPGERSPYVKRALTDFGAEESFGQASQRFEEHYGWKVERSCVRREVENIALQAFEYVENRFLGLATKFKNQEPPKKRCGWNRILVELDGCQIRTGINVSTETQKLTPRRRIKKCKRQVDWREVRVGLARPVEQKDQRTFIARMGQYSEVVSQLKTAAIDRGLST